MNSHGGVVMRVVPWIAACGVVLVACGGDDPLEPPPGPPVSSAAITVVDNSYSPATVLLTAGGMVTWTWSGTNNNSHNVVFTSGPNPPAGYPTLQATGPSYDATFGTAGTYNFHCTNHGGMRGAIFVK